MQKSKFPLKDSARHSLIDSRLPTGLLCAFWRADGTAFPREIRARSHDCCGRRSPRETDRELDREQLYPDVRYFSVLQVSPFPGIERGSDC